VQHFDSETNIVDFERQIVRRLALRASLLEYFQRVQKDRRLVTYHVHYHEDHLFFLMWYLIEVKSWQMKLIVALEDVFKGWQRVDDMPIVFM